MSYQESQRRIFEAEEAWKAGDQQGARSLYHEAAVLQRSFVEGLPADRIRTKSVFGLSAAALFYKAGDLDEAERLAQSLVAEPWIEPTSAVKLRDLLRHIADERMADAPGVIRQRLSAMVGARVRPARRPAFHVARP